MKLIGTPLPGLAAAALLTIVNPLSLFSQAPGATAGTPPANPMQMMEQRRNALLAQCTIIPTPAHASDLPIHTITWGTSGPHVLLIHGGVQGNLGGGPASFLKQEPLSTMGWIVELADRPGFGSSPSRGPDDMTADSVWIAQKLGSSSHLIGHSFGGGELLLAAARKPGAVRSLILVEPALQGMLATDPASANDPVVREGNMRMFGFLLAAKTPGDYATSFAQSLGTDGQGHTNRAAASLEGHPDIANAQGCTLLQAHIAAPTELRAAADIVVKAGIPVLIITGGYSPSTDAAGEAFARILHGRHVIVKSPNHFVQEASPAEFNRVANDFMHQADAAAAH